MKPFLSAGLAALALASVLAPASAIAQPAPVAGPAKQFVPGLAVTNIDAVKASSNAFVNAGRERQTVYKSQLAMAEARRLQINAEIVPLVEKFNRDRQAGNVAQADLQQQAQTIQGLQQKGQQELQAMLAPIALSEAYVMEQINDVISKAITDAMDKKGVTFVVPPQIAVAFNNAYNLDSAVLAELNALLPVAKVAPPAGWQPRATREAQAAQPAAQSARRTPAKPARRIRAGVEARPPASGRGDFRSRAPCAIRR